VLSHFIAFILVGFVQIATAFWGGVVSVKSLPPGESKLKHYGIFLFLGVIGSGLTVWVGLQTYQAEKESTAAQGRAEQSQVRTQEKLDASLQAQARLSGEILAFGSVLGQMKESGNLGMKEVVTAMSQLARATANAQNVELTDKQLCARAMDVAKRMRELEQRFQAQQRAISDREFSASMAATTQEERSKVWNEMTQAEVQLYYQRNQEYASALLAEVLFIRDEMIKKIKTPPPQPQHEGITAFEGTLAGPSPLTMGAAYLEELSKKLCPSN
jgi:hypothetical protein